MLGTASVSKYESGSVFSDFLDEPDLVDHTLDLWDEAAGKAEQSTARLAWDGRKGQWVSIVYAYQFPSSTFDHVVKSSGNISSRRLASFSFPPSKRHAVMLDQGSPVLRVLPKITSKSRNPRIESRSALFIPSPLAEERGRQGAVLYEDTSDEETEASSYDPIDPFNMDSVKPVQPIPWLDDIDIEEFLSSAIEYQSYQSMHLESSTVSQPIFTDTAIHAPSRRHHPRLSPVVPSSPPPPLFHDDTRPIPDFRISPPRE